MPKLKDMKRLVFSVLLVVHTMTTVAFGGRSTKGLPVKPPVPAEQGNWLLVSAFIVVAALSVVIVLKSWLRRETPSSLLIGEAEVSRSVPANENTIISEATQ